VRADRSPAAAQGLAAAAAVRHNGPDLLSYLERRVADRADAADLLAETFLIAWRRVDAIPADDQEARMWLYGVARNVLANHRRGVRRSSEMAGRLRVEVERVARLEDATSSSSARVQDAIDRLPEPLAELVRLVHWDGFGIGDAGDLLGVSASTARGRYARARELLLLELDARTQPTER